MKKIVAIPLCFLLTAALILFSVSLIGTGIIAPAMNKDGAQTGDDVIREELSLVRERIDKLAELYGFEAEPVKEFVNEEKLHDLNVQASRWWSSVMQNGRAGDSLTWDTNELREILYSDPLLTADRDWEKTENSIYTIEQEIQESVFRIVLPMRQNVIRLVLKKAGNRLDLPNLITFFMGIPWTLLALCALLSGLIVLLESRNPVKALPYIGSALGGAALVLAAIAVIYLSAGILPMIREASKSLTIQYRSAESKALITAAPLTAAMGAGCILCLRKRRKGGCTG